MKALRQLGTHSVLATGSLEGSALAVGGGGTSGAGCAVGRVLGTGRVCDLTGTVGGGTSGAGCAVGDALGIGCVCDLAGTLTRTIAIAAAKQAQLRPFLNSTYELPLFEATPVTEAAQQAARARVV